METLAKRRSMGIAGVLLLLMSLIVAVGLPAGAASVIPYVVEGNPNCEDIDLDPLTKFEPPNSGSQLGVTITVTPPSFSWTSNVVISAVIVKGGDSANVYDYQPGGAVSDRGLVAPTNPNNQQPYGLSHIEFCVGGDTTTTTQPTSTTTQPTSTTTQPTSTTTQPTSTTTQPTSTTTQPTSTTTQPTSTTTQPTSTTVATTPSTTSTTSTVVSVGGIQVSLPEAAQVSTQETLPFTGLSTTGVAALAAALGAAGVLLLMASRQTEERNPVRSWN